MSGHAHRLRNPSTGRARRAVLACLLALAAAGCKYDGDIFDDLAPAAATGTQSETPSSGADPVDAFSTTVFPLLRDNCASCHAGAGPGTPHIAHSDAPTAHSAVVDNQKVNFASPDQSRLVRRLSADFHHCWSDCQSDANAMEAAIIDWAAAIDFGSAGTQVSGSLDSAVAGLADGFEDQGAERYRGHLVALYDFREGTGSVAQDTSGVAPAMDLTLQGNVDWLTSYGIDIEEGSARATRDASVKLYDRIAAPGTGTQQYSVEAWVVPDNVDQEGPARIVSYSGGSGSRNFTLGQVLYTYDFRNRSLASGINNNGQPSLRTYDADQDLQASLQHVVMTYDQFQGRRIYVNGLWTDDVDEQGPGRLWSWSDSHVFLLGNETNNDRPWVGQVRLVAVYDHALTDAQISQNFNAGVGKRLILRFDLSQWIGIGSYIEFVVSELDDYSYLFCEPTLATTNPNGFRVANLRISVNGQIAVSGQAFTGVDALVTQPRQRLSRQCSVIAKDRGPTLDEFAVEFEYLGGYQNPVVLQIPSVPPNDEVADPLPGQGLRDFRRINATMARITGVDPGSPGIRDTFLELEQQLPPGFDLRAFSSSQQVGIAKLALEYCDQLVESSALRQSFFGSVFDFDEPATTAFATPAQRDEIIVSLVDGMLGVGLASQPQLADVQPILDGLMDQLTQGCTAASCGADRTRSVVKASCAAVLSSAGVSVH